MATVRHIVERTKRTILPARFLPPKKKIVVFYSSGGGGHISASNAIKTCIGNDYDITYVNIFTELLLPIDFLHTLTLGYLDGEKFYNWCLAHQIIWFHKHLLTLGKLRERNSHASIVQIMRDYFARNNFDMAISVIPLVNGAILEAAQERNLPFLVIPTDLYADMFIIGLHKPTYEKFRLFIPFEDEDIRAFLEKAQIPSDRVTVSGFPIKKQFFEPKDAQKIKQEFKIPENKPVVMLMMGAVGSTACFKYVRRLAKASTPMHIVACIGRAEDVRPMIEAIELPSHMSISIIGFTDRVSDLMAIADLLITKPGSVSFCEGIYSNVPMLLDSTYGDPPWEYFNILIAEKYRFGQGVKSYKQVNTLVETFLNDTNYRALLSHNIKSLHKDRFDDHLRSTVTTLLGA